MYKSPVRGLKAVGCQSFAPGEVGQISLITFPVCGFFSSFSIKRPVCKSTPFAAVT
jgi:hypothetical protein